MDKHKYNVVQEEQEEESEKNMATVNKNKNNNYDNSLYANIGHKHKQEGVSKRNGYDKLQAGIRNNANGDGNANSDGRYAICPHTQCILKSLEIIDKLTNNINLNNTKRTSTV